MVVLRVNGTIYTSMMSNLYHWVQVLCCIYIFFSFWAYIYFWSVLPGRLHRVISHPPDFGNQLPPSRTITELKLEVYCSFYGFIIRQHTICFLYEPKICYSVSLVSQMLQCICLFVQRKKVVGCIIADMLTWTLMIWPCNLPSCLMNMVIM